MMRHIYSIAKNTFKETMRDRVLYGALLLAIAIIGFSVFIGSISIEQDTRMIIDFSLTAIYLLQMFVAIFIGSMLIFKEIERRSFFLIIPKPIQRESIILGKCLGLTATITVVSLVSTVVLCLLLLVKGEYTFFVPIFLSVFLSILESVILILLSLFFSCITSPILAALFTIGFFLIGHSSDIVRTLIMFNDSTPTFVKYILTGTYYLLPNLEKFNIRNGVVYGTLPSITGILLTLLYALCYMCILFLITKITFRKREF